MLNITRIGFTGTRTGMNRYQIKQFENFFLPRKHLISEFHHGDCVGADEDAHYLLKMMEYTKHIKIIIHPPVKRTTRAFCKGTFLLCEEKEYIERTHDIVDSCTLLLAAPKSDIEEIRSGTWATVRYARSIGRDVLILKRER